MSADAEGDADGADTEPDPDTDPGPEPEPAPAADSGGDGDSEPEETESEPEPAPEEGVEAQYDYEEMERDVFGSVYGHEGAKAFVGAALRSGDVHVCLEGPPGSGKSVFLLALDSNVPGVVYRDGDQITASKLRDVLKEDPAILLIDEIDALDNEAYDVLSIPMEHGRLVRDSARETYDVEVGTQVIAACNDLGDLPEHIANRFQVQEFEQYDDEEYVDLCGHMLVDEVEWVTEKTEARRVAETVLEITGRPDPRTARDVAQMARSVDEIQTLATAMEDPDADVEAQPLFPGEIARAKGEVAKVHLRRTLVDDMVRQSQEREAERAQEGEAADGDGGGGGVEESGDSAAAAAAEAEAASAIEKEIEAEIEQSVG